MLSNRKSIGISFGAILVAFATLISSGDALAHKNRPYTTEFLIERCTFSTTGSNPYFILEPGYIQVLEGEEDGEWVRAVITVLKETQIVDGIKTRVVEEYETVDGELVEISRNFYAICKETNSVFYFGEDVDIYEDGEVVSHDGEWVVGENDAVAGIYMPGTVLLGARFFQEIAPDVAMDRAEITSLDATITTPLGTFTNLLLTRETTPLELGDKEDKYYAAGIGIVQDGPLALTYYGY